MAWYPTAIRKEVTRHRTALKKVNGKYRAVVFHIAVSEGASLFGYFNQPGNPTSHFYIRKDGVVEQYVDTQYVAPAQLDGNPTCISIETQGGTESGCSGTWTADQVNSLADITAWLNQIGGLPLQAMPNSKPASVGVGHHRLGVDPYRVSGGELWSSAYGKTCPCDHRIAQIPSIISQAQGADMPLTPQEIQDIATAVWMRDMSGVPASTVMVRMNPGPDGIAATIRDEAWVKMSTSAVDGSAVSVLDLLRFSQGDSRRAITTLQTGGEIKTQLDLMDGDIGMLPNAAEIAAAVVAALPPGSTDLTEEQIIEAATTGCKNALREGAGPAI